jgi:hypothetical protein
MEFFQQRSAEVHRGHGVPEPGKGDGLEPAAGPEVNGNRVVTGYDAMGRKKIPVFPDRFFHTPAYPGITPCKKRIIMVCAS